MEEPQSKNKTKKSGSLISDGKIYLNLLFIMLFQNQERAVMGQCVGYSCTVCSAYTITPSLNQKLGLFHLMEKVAKV